MSNVTLIIPSYRNPKYLDLCLKSAVENRVDPKNEIVVILDGYVEENRDVITLYEDAVDFIELEENQGMQTALNYGVMQATTPYVFIINDDNVMPKEWDARLMKDVLVMGDKFSLTVDQIEPTGPGMFKFPVHDLGQDVDSFDYKAWLEYEYSTKQTMVAGDGRIFPFVMKKKYYLACGGFDTFYDSPNICDWDFFLKLELLGFSFPRTRALRLYHFGSVATKKNAESTQFTERERHAYEMYNWKWGALPYNGNQNTKIHPSGFRGF